MFYFLKKYKLIFIIVIAIILGNMFSKDIVTIFVEKELNFQLSHLLKDRNRAILNEDKASLKSYYDLNTTYGKWAYYHEIKKMKYLHNWSEKQGVTFTEINSDVDVKWIKGKYNGFMANLAVSTEYIYKYNIGSEKANSFRIGTYHSIYIKETDEGFVIAKEWYKDPFADSLNMEEVKSDEIRKYIESQKERDLEKISDRRKKAIEYADKYCGAAGVENRSYNKKYRNFNPLGGDCANFASQILHEGGKFKKTSSWNYSKGNGSRSWLNAQGFKEYMLYSGRASLVAYGDYNKVYKAAYKLLPGDFVAYEKKGKITHISVISGADSKGYSLVNCHNTDRYRVPWDLGWSNKGIKFYLVHVHF
ncbi:amidase domain-containing protein [Anaeromicrobium sediminis]|uniref:Amidase domain-containing protein n=1 Tax=Anaeromicrobium sediminis TaxID=1478221 RepID=A0A267MHF0_9FIRM|nr:amidase domain-containing protein [Anaeromicrobium sediminis]PAB58233.1 amidase domain-containing protein [Anaeromicrobium sediminis]